MSIYKKRIIIIKKQEKIAKTSAKLLLLARWKRKTKRMFKNNKERLQEQALSKYKQLSDEGKDIKKFPKINKN